MATVPGIRRRPDEEERADEEAPLGDWQIAHAETVRSIDGLGWAYILPTAPRWARVTRASSRVPTAPAAGRQPEALDPEDLAARLKARSAELGLSACGVAAYDPKFAFHEHRSKQVGDRIVICALENDWESTQTAPSIRCEKAKLACQTEIVARMAELQQFLVDLGFHARQNRNEIMLLHFAVEAGLGQMGLNGQVLTPQAGSRCRFASLVTDAPLAVDSPRDFGIPKICDACQVCVRRCPAGAITKRRDFHRGVEKAKVNTARCAPTVAKAHHCAVCIKVCPVQRYGLDKVMAEFVSSGRILGKDSDELESYEFEGQVYPHGERPTLRAEWFAEIPYRKPTKHH
jgi:epoxyqueuosine reductase